MLCAWFTRRLQQEVELQVHSLGLLQERIGASEPAQLAAAVAALETELAAAQLSATTSAASKRELVATAQVGGNWAVCERFGRSAPGMAVMCVTYIVRRDRHVWIVL